MKRLGIALLVTALAGSAWAGYNWPTPVEIYPTIGLARGSMGTARNGAGLSYLGCTVYAGSTWTTPLGYCYASDANHNYASCFIGASSPTLVTVLASINSDSVVGFEWDLNTGQCRSVDVQNTSSAEPKKP